MLTTTQRKTLDELRALVLRVEDRLGEGEAIASLEEYVTDAKLEEAAVLNAKGRVVQLVYLIEVDKAAAVRASLEDLLDGKGGDNGEGE